MALTKVQTEMAGAGSVLQVVQANLTTTMSWTGTTAYVDILSATITPKSATSKILVMCSVESAAQDNMTNLIVFNMTRNGSTIVKSTAGGATDSLGGWGSYGGLNYATSGRAQLSKNLNYLDSPSSTSALTYKIAAKTDQSINTAYIGRWSLNSDSATITSLLLMEIAG